MERDRDGTRRRENAYARIITAVFEKHYRKGKDEFTFKREELAEFAKILDVKLPKNLGDVLYSFRYRERLPERIAVTAKAGCEWIIEGAGKGRYAMRLVRCQRVVPRPDLIAIKIPDATPEIVSMYAQSDEQALLAKVRYNRLVDIFLGVTTYSLQNHLRTTVQDVGQIEIDEIYVGVDKAGVQYVIPVQAKSGNDRHSIVQTKQDLLCCEIRFPELVCRAVSAQFLDEGAIAMFELAAVETGEVKVVQERHYLLVSSDGLSENDLRTYRKLSGKP